MEIFTEPGRADWPAIMNRARKDDAAIESTVRDILTAVRTGGDEAIRDLSLRIDGVAPASLEADPRERAAAADAVPEALQAAIRTAAANIRTFHEAQRTAPVRVDTAPGVVCTQRSVPIRTVGLYVPGGSAPLFSTVLMLAVPAAVAGCRRVVLCTPPDRKGGVAPAILFAAGLCGVHQVFKIGGAQAVAAMAYGTATVPRCDKIFGPGNRYVMKAKQMVASECTTIDLPAGPSEVMVLADRTCVPAFVAADLLSQAEHGPDSQVMLVCTDRETALRVDGCLQAQLEGLPRRDIARQALAGSRTVILADRNDVVDFANDYAPEHLIVALENPREAADRILTAGSIFLGNWSCESAGDYASGTNHTLPTAGWARACSGVNLDSFLRKTTCQELSRAGLSALAPTLTAMAEAEGLRAHADAVRIRLES